MSRRVKSYAPGELRRYVPEAFGNARDPEPVTVWIRYPTERQKRELDKVGGKSLMAIGADGKVVRDAAGNPIVEVDNAAANRRAELACELFVEKVENYTNAAGEPIENGAELALHGETEILSDIASEIEHSLTLRADLGKSSSAQSDSKQSETQASAGTAPGASEKELTSSATVAPELTPSSSTSRAVD
jgi:hypothetical protein